MLGMNITKVIFIFDGTEFKFNTELAFLLRADKFKFVCGLVLNFFQDAE